MITRSQLLMGAVAGAFALGGTASAQDSYPERPVTIVVPYGPGGGVGINTRALAPHLAEALGVEVVVEHRTGAGGVVGHTYGAVADPDGYTLTMVSPGIVAAPLLVDGVEFSPDSYDYIGQVTFVPNLLAVASDAQWESVDELVAYMQEHPGEVSAGATNGWPSSDVALAVFAAQAGVEPLMVTGMSGGAEKLAGVLGGTLDIVMGNINELLPQHEAGTVRILAAAALERSPLLPDVPTFREEGYNVTTGVWRTLAAPAGTPQEILDTVNAALQEALASEALADDFEQAALTIDYLPPDETRELVMEQYDDLSQIFSELGLNVQD